ncbi:hypothetical protein AAFN60_00080 [Roseibacillus persicicus]|uniref:hypothetical protein n=1 Tax=Roseibacillus persicicus TaxID=454148 RepID=UPI00398B7632
MKMISPQDETPEELRGITEILEKSLQPHPQEEVPPMPDDLRERLRGQYGDQQAASEVKAPGLWAQLKSLFAQPAFSGALAALVLVGVLMSLLLKPDPAGEAEQMRGKTTGPSSFTAIILFDLDESQTKAVMESGYFDSAHLHPVTTEAELMDWISREGQSIVVNGATGEIRHEDGRQVPMPAKESDIADVVAELLAK